MSLDPTTVSPRTQFLLSTSTSDSRILEIGPSHAPIAPRVAGWQTQIIDTADAESLRRKFTGTGSDLDAIETVDFIWQGGGLESPVPSALYGTFDTLIASHVIEHIPDFVRFFQSTSVLLGTTGTIALAIPDYRYCFDCFRPPSSTGEIVAAYRAGAIRHRRATIFDHTAYACTQNGVGAWGQHPVGNFGFMDSLANAWRTIDAIDDENGGNYFDSHAWQFTPSRFRLILLELAQLGLMDWHIDRLHDTDGCEFLVILKRGGVGPYDEEALNRLRFGLLEDCLRETQTQISFVLGMPVGSRTEVTALKSSVDDLSRQLAAQQQTLDHQMMLLDIQAQQLVQVAQVAAWHAKLLSPIRALWRKLRPGLQ